MHGLLNPQGERRQETYCGKYRDGHIMVWNTRPESCNTCKTEVLSPTNIPSVSKQPTLSPTDMPSNQPSFSPTGMPSTDKPTRAPVSDEDKARIMKNARAVAYSFGREKTARHVIGLAKGY